MSEAGYLGIDVGSISTNLVLLGREDQVLFQSYRRVDGHPIRSVQAALQEICLLYTSPSPRD